MKVKTNVRYSCEEFLNILKENDESLKEEYSESFKRNI